MHHTIDDVAYSSSHVLTASAEGKEKAKTRDKIGSEEKKKERKKK